MKTLKPIPQCIDCLISLAKSATALAGADDAAISKKAEAVPREMRTDPPADSSSGRKLSALWREGDFFRITLGERVLS